MAEETVLIVDDDPAHLGVLVQALTEQGLRVLVAQDGEEGLERARLTLPDLILLDVMMPGPLDGFDTCRLLKSESTISDVPVIFMTALSDAEAKLAGFSAGGVDFVAKPIQIAEVVARVRTHLDLYTLRRQLAKQNEELDLARRDLEQRVQARTAALAAANAALEAEIGERRRAERALQASAEQIRDLYNNAPCGYHSVDAQGRFVQINDTELKWLGHTREELVGKRTIDEFLSPESRRVFEKGFPIVKTQGWVRDLEVMLVRRDGSLMPVLLSSTAVRDAEGRFVMTRTTLYDLTERKRTEERIRYLAHHDALTGLPNRTLFQDRLGQLLAHAPRHREAVAVVFADLDQFAHVNDSLGHEAGDLVLREASVRLGRCLRESDTLARWGGDEFAVALATMDHGDHAALVAEKLLEALAVPFLVHGHELHLTGSIGIGVYPADGQDAKSLLRAADTALYHAKQKGRGSAEFFTPALTDALQRRVTLASQLRRALERGELYLEYQPQVDLDNGRVFGVEALLRWRHPEAGVVMPGEFIPVAEEMGLIEPLGDWVLREACRKAAEWRRGGLGDLTVAINLSVRQFRSPRFPDRVAEVLAEFDCPPEALELEITENVLMEPSEHNLQTLARLDEMGVGLAVDDFGMGYSSMAYLQSFPIHTLKIDRSFVSRIGDDGHDGAIVAAIVAIAQSLRLRVIAEGVEDAEQAAFLKARGCLAAQGYYYGRPLSPQRLSERVREAATPHSAR